MTKIYREGDMDETAIPAATSDGSAESATPGWFQDETIDTKDAPKPEGNEEAPTTDTELFTAVLLVQTHSGTVFPITNLDNLKLHHTATPHEVLRMCHDVTDQISAVRIIGEILRNNHVMLQQNFTALAKALGIAPRTEELPKTGK